MQAASSLSVPSRLAPTAWLISSAERGRSAASKASNTPSSQEEKTTWVKKRWRGVDRVGWSCFMVVKISDHVYSNQGDRMVILFLSSSVRGLKIVSATSSHILMPPFLIFLLVSFGSEEVPSLR